MSTPQDTAANPTQANPTQANPTAAKASNFLANLNRFTARPEPAAPPAPTAKPSPEQSEGPDQPQRQAQTTPAAIATPKPAPKRRPRPTPTRSKPAEPTMSAEPKPMPQPPTAIRPDATETVTPTATETAGTKLHRSFTVAPGTGTKVLTARVPRALHARLTLLATANKFADTDEHEQDFTTVNAIVMDALHDWLAKHDPTPAEANNANAA